MSCCGQKTSGYTRAIRVLMDKALALSDQGREEESEQILAGLSDYFEKLEQRKTKKQK